MAAMTDQSPLAEQWRQHRTSLVADGLLVRTALDGVYGRGAQYERVVDGVRRVVGTVAAEIHGDAVTALRFPPVFGFDSYEKTDYIASFPDLTGVIHTFTGGNPEHRALLADRADGLPWDHHLHASDKVLVSAACHPSYEVLEGTTVPEQGLVVNVESWCFRHEPSVDPFRMQSFRMHEYVTIGTPEQAAAHRESWTAGAERVLRLLGLEPDAVPANDPFFGRVGQILASNQLEENLKTELVVRHHGDLDEGTALISANLHQDHFGGPFAISTTDGAVAHSACVGIGMDRIALSVLRRHGHDVDAFPAEVLAAMGE